MLNLIPESLHNGPTRSTCEFVCIFQDGFLERLSSSEFVALCKDVEKFVNDCELVCDRKSLSLRGCLQSQVRFH